MSLDGKQLKLIEVTLREKVDYFSAIGQSIGQFPKSNFAIPDKYRQNEVSNNGL